MPMSELEKLIDRAIEAAENSPARYFLLKAKAAAALPPPKPDGDKGTFEKMTPRFTPYTR